MQQIVERKIELTIPKQKKLNRAMPVFYNSLMQSHRDISVLLLNSITQKQLNIALPLAGSGIRALRFLKELKQDKIKSLFVNDKKASFIETFEKNLHLNNMTKDKIKLFNQDASLFLSQQEELNYIDLDPFGSPNPFLSAAVKSISRGGILAVTATDTAALTGTYPKATRRKYWAKIQKQYFMHEIGLRILIRKVQLQGIQFNKALTPIFSYHKNHYFRIFFVSSFGKTKCDDLLKQHQYFLYNPKTTEFKITKNNYQDGWQTCGPLWVGDLQDKKLVQRMEKINKFPEEKQFLNTIKHELDIVGYYDVNILGKKYRCNTPKMEPLLERLKGTRTHFSMSGFKTKKSLKEIINKIKKTN